MRIDIHEYLALLYMLTKRSGNYRLIYSIVMFSWIKGIFSSSCCQYKDDSALEFFSHIYICNPGSKTQVRRASAVLFLETNFGEFTHRFPVVVTFFHRFISPTSFNWPFVLSPKAKGNRLIRNLFQTVIHTNDVSKSTQICIHVWCYYNVFVVEFVYF